MSKSQQSSSYSITTSHSKRSHSMLTRSRARSSKPIFGTFPKDVWSMIMDAVDAKSFVNLATLNKSFHQMSIDKIVEIKDKFSRIVVYENQYEPYSPKKLDKTIHYLPNGDVWKYNATNSADGKLVESFYYNPKTKTYFFERSDLVKETDLSVHYKKEIIIKPLKIFKKENRKNIFLILLTIEYLTDRDRTMQCYGKKQFQNYHLIAERRPMDFIYLK